MAWGIETDPEFQRSRRMSIFIVPRETPGIEIVCGVAARFERSGGHHACIRYDNVHKVARARQMLGNYAATDDLFPECSQVRRREAAIAKYDGLPEREVGNL